MADLPAQVTNFLGSCAPFDTLNEDALNDIARRFTVFYLTEEGSRAYFSEHSGSLFLVQSGQFEICEGQSQVRFVSEGDYFGYIGALNNKLSSIEAKVDVPGLVYCLSQKHLQMCLTQHANIEKFFRALGSKNIQSQAMEDTQSLWLYTKIEKVIEKEAVTADKSVSIQYAATQMTEQHVSSLMITEADKLVGIITDRDIRRKVVSTGIDGSLPVKNVMTTNPFKIESDRTLFDALCMMAEKDIHHLPVVKENSLYAIGMISATDIIRQQRSNILFLIHELGKANNLYELTQFAWQIPHYFAQHAHRLGDYDIAGKVLTQATDMMTRKLLDFFIQNEGKAPLEFCWLVYGSQAREDQTMGSDQDNGLLLSKTPNDEEANYFSQMGEYVCQGLGKCGIKLCSGNIMASSPDMRISVDCAIEESRRWIYSPTKHAIMHFNIYLDVRAVAGNAELLNQLHTARAPILSNGIFLAALARHINDSNVPLSIFQKFITAKNRPEKDSIDLKKQAVNIINELVRLYALSHQITVPGTLARLKLLVERSVITKTDADNMHDIWLFLNRLRWRHQLENNITDNFVRLSDLSSLEKHQLKDAFQIIKHLQQVAVIKFAGGITA